MSGEYDSILDEEEARLKEDSLAPASPYAAALDAEAEARGASLNASLNVSVGVNADAAARHAGLAAKAGLPRVAVERNEEQVARAVRARELQELVRLSPVLGKQLADPEFARLAHDDAEQLSVVETIFSKAKNAAAALAASVPRFNAAAWGAAQAAAEGISNYVTGPLAGTILPQDPAAIAAQKFAALRRDQEGFAKDIRRNESGGFVEQSIYGGLESLGLNLLTLPAALATGNPNMALVPMAAVTGGQEFGKARDLGKDFAEALTFASSQAVIEYATEKLPVSRLIGDVKAGTPFWKMVAGQAATEIPGEQLATVLQDLNEWAVLKPDAPFSQYLAERPSAAAQTLISTVVSVGGQTTVVKGVQMAVDRLGGDIQRAEAAQADQELLTQLSQLANASKLRERSPDSFAAFVQAAAADGQVSDVFVNANVLMQSLEKAGVRVAQMPRMVVEQLAEAGAVGGDVRIPIGEYAAKIAADEKLGPVLLEHLKTSPEAMSAAEAQVFMQEQAGALKAQAEQILGEQQDQLAAQTEAEGVKQHFVQELRQANRFTAPVNEAYATLMRDFYTVTAQRLGITTTEMLQRYPLRVAAENVAADVVMDQAGDGTHIRGKDGNPLTVFRGAAQPLAAEHFNPQQFGAASGNSSASLGVWFTPSRSEAAGYGNVEGFHLDIRNPAVYKVEDLPGFDSPQEALKFREALQRKGHDGIVISARHLGGGTHIVAFSPEQVKRSDQSVLQQTARGQIAVGADITKIPSVVSLLKNADLSTFLHESGHFYLEVLVHIASQPGAPAEVVQDVKAILKWFRVKDLETWHKMALDQKRPHHEKFARGFEAYLFEGKSPNLELQSLFSRFRAWLINVYKSLAALNVELTDGVRGVFDRMLASEEAIRAAEGFRAMAPMFASQEDAGASEAEWKAYSDLGKDATDRAVKSLERRSLADLRWLDNARDKALHRIQQEADAKRDEIRKEVEAEVKQEPIQQAIRFLTKGEITRDGEEVKALKGFKLDRAAVDALIASRGIDPALFAKTDVARMTVKEGGLEPGPVGEMFGFDSGDALVQALLGAEPFSEKVAGLTDQRMLERYGDLVDERAIERAADAEVHSEARARFVASELRFLSRAMTKAEPTAKGGSVNVLAKAAKNFAETIIARKKINDIRPAQYAAAETRAAKAADKLRAAGKTVEAATEKRNQLVNLHATRAATTAIEEVEKSLRYLRKFDRDGTRKNLDIEYLDQIDQLLERFELKPVTQRELAKRASLIEWMESQREQGFEPTIDKALEREAQRQNYSTMTLEEFRGLVEAVKNIEHLGRLKKKLLTAKDEREYAERVAEAKKSIEDNSTGTVPETRASDRGPLVGLGKLFKGFVAEHRKFASLMREMDGIKDGGVMWELLSRSMNEAGDKEAGMREAATVKLAEIMKPILRTGGLGVKTAIPGLGKSFTREERIGIALNMGNVVNRERVMSGEAWTPMQLQVVLDTLTKEEWDFVQATWDYLESWRPVIAEKTRRVQGFEPEWVEAQAVQTKFGEYRGGYYPIKYDPERSDKSEADDAAAVQRQMERGLYVRATTRRGHLEERAKSTGRPMRYDLGVIVQHVDQVVHDLSWHEWLIDANRLVRSLAPTIREHYGNAKHAQLKSMLRDIAVGELGTQDHLERVLNHLRHGATIVGLGWSVTTALLQPLGLTQSMVRVGPKWIAKGLAKWLGDATFMESSVATVQEKSTFMRLRAKTMQREINEIRNKIADRNSAIEASFFFLIQKLQLVADMPTWHGAYEKAYATDDNMTEEKAIALADQAVRDSQGSGQIGDLAAIQRGGAFKKLWTNFYSFFSTTYNLAVEQAKLRKRKGQVIHLAGDYLLLFILPSVLGTLMKSILAGDDEDETVRKLIADQIGYILGTMIGLREVGTAAAAAFGAPYSYGGPAGLRFFTEITKLGKQIGQGEVDEAFLKAAANTAGVLFHLPTGQVSRLLDGIHALVTGKTANPGALVVGSRENN